MKKALAAILLLTILAIPVYPDVILGRQITVTAGTAIRVVTGNSLTTGATKLDLSIDTAKLAFSETEFQLETGKPYTLNVTSDGLEELGVMAPDLFQNSWINQLVIDDMEVKMNGAPSSIEFDDEGTISVSFVPIRPGNYSFYSPGFEKAGLTGTFVVR